MTTTLRPSFPAQANPPPESPEAQTLIKALNLQAHIEGGYFAETDRDPLLIPSPFPSTPALAPAPGSSGGKGGSGGGHPVPQRPGFDPSVRNASTSIYYLLTPSSPQGNFHRNRGRTVHTLHRGRGRYVLIHADQPGCPVETFVVGHNVAAGERLQWIVEGGKFKASFLLPDHESGDGSSGGLLISETVVPGFEFFDHDFLQGRDALRELVGDERVKELEWLVRE